MQLTLLSAAGGVTRMECAGEVTQTALGENTDPFEEALGEKGFADKVLVSLLGADCIDSAGVGLFILCHKKFRESGGMLVLHSIPPLIKHLFQFLKMDTVLHLAKDEAAALALVQRGQS